jgi:hypothetical protein
MPDNYEIRADGQARWEIVDQREVTFRGQTYTRAAVILHPNTFAAQVTSLPEQNVVELTYQTDTR